MKIEFKTYMQQDMAVGQEVNIDDVKWYALERCTLIGSVIDTGVPVVIGEDGPEIASTQLTRADMCASKPVINRTRIENVTLIQYKRIDVNDLVGANIVAAMNDVDTMLFITDEKGYVKMEASRGYDDCGYFQSEPLSMVDLYNNSLISDETWATHEAQREACREESKKALKLCQFRKAAREVGLGKAKVEELLNGQM